MSDEHPRRRQAQPIEAASNPKALLKVATVAAVTGLSERTIWRWSAQVPPRFPPPVTVGTVSKRWVAGEVMAWMAAQQSETAP